MDTAQIAQTLGLGPLRGPVEVLKSDEHSPVWKVVTDSGVWVLKVTVPHGDYWLPAAAQAGRLEAAAWHAGIAMPEPHQTELTDVGLWRPVGEHRFARAMRFLDGEHPPLPFAPPLAAWAGGVVAAFEKLAIPSDPTVDADPGPYPLEEWDEWLGQAVDLGVLDTTAAKSLRDVVLHINPISEAALAKRPEKLLMHRDFSVANVLVTDEGPALLDFDAAGPNEPWWELVSVAVELAGPALGVMRPDRASFEACVRGFSDAGGRIGPTDESAFVGILGGRLASTAWELWMACGHRGGSAEMHAQFARQARASIEALTLMVDGTREWATWF